MVLIHICKWFFSFSDDNRLPNNNNSKGLPPCSDDDNANAENSAISPVSSSDNSSMVTSMASVAAAAAASRQWYSNKADMIPFLSLCSRYPGSPWAGLLQHTIKEKQKGIKYIQSCWYDLDKNVCHPSHIPVNSSNSIFQME